MRRSEFLLARRVRTASSALLVTVALVATASTANAQTPPPPPPTARRSPVSDTYHGTTVVDEYRWLEDGASPEVKAWSDSQNRRTREYLGSMPVRAAILDRLKSLVGHIPTAYFPVRHAGGLWFCDKLQASEDRFSIVALSSIDDLATEKLVFDAKALDPSGQTNVGTEEASPDGRLIALSLARSGSEIAALHVYEVDTGRELGDVIPRFELPTAMGSLAWTADSKGFFYTRYPSPGERPDADSQFYQQVYFHRIGTPVAEDSYAVGREFPRIAETTLSASPDQRHHLARVANGDGGEVAFYLHQPDGAWTQICGFKDGVKNAAFGADGGLYLTSTNGSPRGKVLRLAVSDPVLSHARVVVPESAEVIRQVLPTQSRLYVLGSLGGPSDIRVFDLRGHPMGRVALLPVSSARELLAESDDTILFTNGSHLLWDQVYRYDPRTRHTSLLESLAVKAPIDLHDMMVQRVFATSKDGTRVPMHILHRRALPLRGDLPTLLTGYGGYGTTKLQPEIVSAMQAVWLEAGGVVALTGLRGGGEYGEAWHRAGNLTRKQNVFDDFEACARYLIGHRYTNPGKLAIEGASNGGLLMGAALTQHPELYRAVVSSVGMYDMLRFETSPNGAFNVTEFGSVKDADQYKALYAYSPYHRVADGTAYPAVLMITGDNDGRVDPMNSRKMTARLQAASSSGRPILLRTSATAGHHESTVSAFVEESADALTFLFSELGVDNPSPAHRRTMH